MRPFRSALLRIAIIVPLSLFAAPAFADAFLKVLGVDGESTDDKHKGDIELKTFTSEQRASSAAGRAAVQDFHFTKTVDKASPKLFAFSSKGTVIPSVTLEFSFPDQKPIVWRAVLTDVVVSSYKTLPGGTNVPTEEVGLTAARVEIFSRAVLPTGSFGDWVKRDLATARKEVPSLFLSPPPRVMVPPAPILRP
jgi:type VI secretion system secreted protein Hcp